MAKLLYIEASPRKDRSRSTQVARTFLAAYQKSRPDDSIQTIDLWATSLPRFDGATIEAKYAILQGQTHTPGQAQAWNAVVDVAEQFKSADKYLFSLPMWNFGLPYILKHYIDVLIQPGLTFSFDPQTGYKGLVTGKKAVAVYARGGAYGPGTGMEDYDLQSKALTGILGFIGLTDLVNIFVEPMLGPPEVVAAGLAKAEELAVATAKSF
ncbi:MAG: NAD(P)H-dependent oxidoreductase [Verrucomicrobia bacterium]|nr:NAD(P)H-dependent oxidoreductase [Verrucomicrobiota bacterium]